MRINTNIAALRASNSLNKSNNSLTKSLERLSSGYRINKAADDAAGLAISQKMRTQIAGLDQADRNSSDGISLIQTAEGALVEVQSMAQRIRELSVQAANGTNTEDDRSSIQAEIDELTDEIQRISETTEFNTLSLLDGSCDRKSFSNEPAVTLLCTSTGVAVGSYSIKVTQDARQAVFYGASIGSIGTGKVSAAEAGTININGVDITIEEGDSMDEVYSKLREGCEKVNINVFSTEDDEPDMKNATADTAYYEPSNLSVDSKLVFVSKEYGSDQYITINCNNTTLANLMGFGSDEVKVEGYDVKATLDSDSGNLRKTATVSTKGNTITITDQNDFEMVMEAEHLGSTFKDAKVEKVDDKRVFTPSTEPSKIDDKKVTMTVLSAGSLKLQVGANEGQTVEIAIQKINPKTLGIDNLNVNTSEGAQKAITLCDTAIAKVSEVRSKLGAYQNRLEHTVNNLGVASENMTEALSRIQDTDMASEMATYTQNNVLVQAGTSMLAQANQLPQQILSLLNA